MLFTSLLLRRAYYDPLEFLMMDFNIRSSFGVATEMMN